MWRATSDTENADHDDHEDDGPCSCSGRQHFGHGHGTNNNDSNDPNQQDLVEPDLKVIILGDSAVGKSKLVERYMMDDYNPRRLSTHALTIHRKNVRITGKNNDDDTTSVTVDFWDTAGQEKFNSMHPSYYYRAHVCIMVFDVTRKQTYLNLHRWYGELRQHCPNIPCILVANKVDVDYMVTRKNFKFPREHNVPLYFVSSADGTNVVKVFEEAVCAGLGQKKYGEKDLLSECLELFQDGPFLRDLFVNDDDKRRDRFDNQLKP
ncbi:hypothetical protein ACHAWU_003706 [Discostella pseudostelligera]|jgi:Rab-like protein 2|uniref:Uncharacterized protein n=1 Tax=Discostella pseudostelligera TaxID=259834 RepID=A0ABD3NB67_9STRA